MIIKKETNHPKSTIFGHIFEAKEIFWRFALGFFPLGGWGVAPGRRLSRRDPIPRGPGQPTASFQPRTPFFPPPARSFNYLGGWTVTHFWLLEVQKDGPKWAKVGRKWVGQGWSEQILGQESIFA